MRSSRLFSAALAVPLLAALTTSVAGSHVASAQDYGDPATYLVEFTNTTTGQYLTPPNFAAHESGVHVWQRNRLASPGVQAVAENGAVPVLAAEVAAAIDATGSGVSTVGGDGPLAPGATTSFEISTTEDRFSLVSMIICTNDGFGGIDSGRLPQGLEASQTFRVRGYDAGTERNTELRADLVPAPFCGEGGGTGESNPDLAENGRITRHSTLRGVGDLAESLDWTGAVGELTITRLAPEVTYTVTIENLTDGQYLTPPNWAAHGTDVDVFQRGRAASAGVQAVAENGGVPVLAAELSAAIDDQGAGVSGVGGDAPIPPGGSVTFDVTTTERRVSIVSMIICTNDGFAGIDSRPLPGWAGQSRTFFATGYDAGTEVNTELRADLVPAPFCGDGAGSTESNPELAEDGVIRPHRTLRGVGDLADSLDWNGALSSITITRNN